MNALTWQLTQVNFLINEDTDLERQSDFPKATQLANQKQNED